MSIRFPYTHLRSSQPIIALGGRFVHPRPLIPVSLIGPAGTELKDALLDSGSDYTLFSAQSAKTIGLDLSNAPHAVGAGIGKAVMPIRFAQASLRISDGVETREWSAWVGFVSIPLKHPIMGFAGALQFFDLHLRGALEEFELAVNALYPGT